MTMTAEFAYRPLSHDEISNTFDEACRKAGASPSALLLSGHVVCSIFNWSRATKDRRAAEGLLPVVRDGGRVRHPRKGVEQLYRKMLGGGA